MSGQCFRLSVRLNRRAKTNPMALVIHQAATGGLASSKNLPITYLSHGFAAKENGARPHQVRPSSGSGSALQPQRDQPRYFGSRGPQDLAQFGDALVDRFKVFAHAVL